MGAPGRPEGRRHVPTAKLTVPRPPADLVPRPRLSTVLDRGTDAAVTLVCGAAGAGKTVLLAEWAARRAGRTAWLSVDEDDSDDGRFWSALLDSLSDVVPEHNPVRLLPVPLTPSADPEFLADLVNALDDLSEPVNLVLDDLHEVIDAAPIQGLAALLRHRPDNLRLVLSSRRYPPLPLAKVRLAGELLEVPAEALSFSLAEARALLDASGVHLDRAQLEELVDRTEGWVAVLRLAATALAGAPDPQRVLADFGDRDRAVAAYLVEEVLSRLDAADQRFLRSISVCDPVSADLANHLTGGGDGGERLAAFLDGGVVVEDGAGPRPWYHVHTLLREHLHAALQREEPERAAQLHGLASDWHAEHDAPAHALTHITHTGDVDRIGTLVRRYGVALALTGRHEPLARAFALLDDAGAPGNCESALVAAWLHAHRGDVEAADRALWLAESTWPADAAADLVRLSGVVRSRCAQLSGRREALRSSMHRIVVPTASGDVHLDAAARLQAGAVSVDAGDGSTARGHLAAALAVAGGADND
ncbi:MAG: LuxR family transcriptional regulator, partial [Saccharothrix sp.]|nr:LuxR family transcriptional regulator [Saccharothrix sp.]